MVQSLIDEAPTPLLIPHSFKTHSMEARVPWQRLNDTEEYMYRQGSRFYSHLLLMLWRRSLALC